MAERGVLASILLAALLGACVAAPFSTDDSAGECPELQGFASYAYQCTPEADAIVVCQADSGVTSVCSQATQRVRACTCDSLTVCTSSTQAVACTRRTSSAQPDAGSPL
jgi:hypothetical protein